MKPAQGSFLYSFTLKVLVLRGYTLTHFLSSIPLILSFRHTHLTPRCLQVIFLSVIPSYPIEEAG